MSKTNTEKMAYDVVYPGKRHCHTSKRIQIYRTGKFSL